MSKILTIADLHLTDRAADEYRHAFIEDLPTIIDNRKPDALAILGDLTEEKDHHGARLVNRVVRHLKALADLLPVVVLMGNHDYHNEGHPFFEFIDMIPNLKWIGKVTRFTSGPFDNCLFLPHTRNHERDWNGIDLAAPRYVFAHNTFQGAGVGFGRELGGIPIDTLPRKARVIAGDVHMPQQLGPVTYVGPPYTIDFGDDFKPRLLLLEGYSQSIGVGKWPQKRLVSVDDVSQLDHEAKQLHSGDILKVRCAVDDMGQWHSTHKHILAWAAECGFIAQRVEPVLMQTKVKKRYKLSTKQDDLELVEQYAKRHDLTPETIKVGKEFL